MPKGGRMLALLKLAFAYILFALMCAVMFACIAISEAFVAHMIRYIRDKSKMKKRLKARTRKDEHTHE
jgi:hypothetical protein